MNLGELCDEILGSNDSITHVAVINSQGRPVEESSRAGQTVFNNEDQKEMLMMQCSLTISMGRDFDQPFGEIKYVHTKRENLSLYSFPLDNQVILVASKASQGPISLAREVLAIIKTATKPRMAPRAEPIIETVPTY